MGTFRQRNPNIEPSIVVGWAAGLVNAWPEESSEPIVAAGADPSGSRQAARVAASPRRQLVDLIAS